MRGARRIGPLVFRDRSGHSRRGRDVKLLSAVVHAIDWLNERVGRAVSWLTVLMVINVFIVVVLRYTLSVGWIWMQELYVWSHATVFLLGAGYTLLHEGHVRIDLIYREASLRYKAIINILGSLILGGPLIYLIFDRSLPMISRSWDSLEKSAEAGGMPGLFVFKSVVAVFAVLFGLQLLALFLRSVETLLGADDDPEYLDTEDQEGGI
ncbi:MAG: TRAP transporter small permease subunit [Rhodospirillaceae bacterium]|nr:TRAP transporter small permease subunit [Rhodospirillaceae bacterium]MBT6860526.1 TRAP transporter small permease subunit [Rhodospirillaceae bacterium]